MKHWALFFMVVDPVFTYQIPNSNGAPDSLILEAACEGQGVQLHSNSCLHLLLSPLEFTFVSSFPAHEPSCVVYSLFPHQ